MRTPLFKYNDHRHGRGHGGHGGKNDHGVARAGTASSDGVASHARGHHYARDHSSPRISRSPLDRHALFSFVGGLGGNRRFAMAPLVPVYHGRN